VSTTIRDTETNYQLRTIGEYLIRLSEAPEAGVELATALPLPVGADYLTHTTRDAPLGRLAAVAYEQRRRRERFLPPDLFGEPAWDILLDLFIAGVTEREISVSSACLASAVPETTALRWIGELVERGLVKRRSDVVDKRRHFLSLSENGFRAMRGYFDWVDMHKGAQSSQKRALKMPT
jgi:hypothetical protein